VVVTALKRQISKKSGAEYARLTLEDFTDGEALVFRKAWAKLNGVIHADGAYLLTGGYIPPIVVKKQAPFIVIRHAASTT